MSNYPSRTRGRIFSALTVIILLAVAGGLYMQIVMKEKPIPRIDTLNVPTASVQVLEGSDVPEVAAPAPQPLPDDQMGVVLQVFAPERAGQ